MTNKEFRQQIQEETDEETRFNQSSQQTIAELDKVPEFMKFNKHITQGYRLNFQSPYKIIKSLFIFHNESINIWTHIIGTLVIFSFILGFFIIVDKAELQYQLKKYESNLSEGFNDLNQVLHRVQNTLHNFEQTQTKVNIEQDFKRFQFQLRDEYNKITYSVKDQIQEIKKILTQNIQMTNQEKQMRLQIYTELNQFQHIQKQFQTEVNHILWENYNDKVYTKAHLIQTLRKQIQELQNDISKKVIAYLQLQKSTPNPYGVPRWPIIFFLITATICLGFSATFHLFFPMSSRAFTYFRRGDYAGVTLSIIGTGVTPVYYALYCKPYIAAFYITVIILCGSALFITLLGDYIQRPQNEKYKPIMFGIFGFTYIIPYGHFMISEIFFDNFGDSFRFSHSNFWWTVSVLSYIAGLTIFIKKWPEIKYKHKFDFIGNSHQIWHFLCMAGLATTYLAININYQTRKQCPCP